MISPDMAVAGLLNYRGAKWLGVSSSRPLTGRHICSAICNLKMTKSSTCLREFHMNAPFFQVHDWSRCGLLCACYLSLWRNSNDPQGHTFRFESLGCFRHVMAIWVVAGRNRNGLWLLASNDA